MTEDRDGRTERVKRPKAARRRVKAVARMIDGEAVRITGRASKRAKPPRTAGTALACLSDDGRASDSRAPASGGRWPLALAEGSSGMPAPSRMAGPRRSRQMTAALSPDLVFQGTSSNEWLLPRTRPSLQVFKASDRSARIGRFATGCGVLFSLGIIGLWAGGFFGALERSTGTPSGITLSDLTADIRSRGEVDVLSVEGLIRNNSTARAVVPPMQIALLGDDGVSRSKAFAAGIVELPPGQAVHFSSHVALPAGTGGDVSIGFADKGTSQ